MNKMKLLLWFFIIMIVILSPRIYIFTLSLWDYLHADKICVGRHPSYPSEKNELFPFTPYEVRPFSVITDKGKMYLGDEYEVVGEVRNDMATLIWVGNNGAYFLISYNDSDSQDGNASSTCRWFTPIGDYR